MKICIVGSGISGLSAALALSEKHEVFLFEKNNYFGGHSNTIQIKKDGNSFSVDTGFIVFNEKNYPNLTSLFKNLNVKTKPSKMSFGFSLGNGELEYSGSNFNSFFAQRKNLFSKDHLKGLYDIFRFKGIALKFLSDCQEANESMRDFLLRNNFGKWFSEMFIVPMGAAIWSVPTGSILDFPARSYLQFFLNHGLLSMLTTEIDWKTVDGGSVKYVEKIIQKLGKNAFVNTPVKKLIRKKNKCEVTFGNGKRKMLFDKVVLSCDGPETLKIIGDASEKEKHILGLFKTSKNKVVLHGDSSHMPRIKKVWSSWNFITSNIQDSINKPVEVTYWMNKLQNISSRDDIFVTLNPSKEIDNNKIFYETSYSHPIFDKNTITAQELTHSIQGENNIYYAGAKMGFGFHEDGLNSGLEVARRLECVPSWSTKER